jgi:hypothetical protein
VIRLLGFLAVVAAMMAFAESASASVAAVEGRSVLTATDSATQKTATALCTPGKKILGAGISVSSAGHRLLRAVRPHATLTGVTFEASEDQDGDEDTWRFNAVARCATAPAGLERIAVTSATNSTQKTVTATCSPGKQVTGVGGEITGGAGEVWLDDLRPEAGLTSVAVQGVEDENGTAAAWSVTAYAICSVPVGGLERVVADSASTSENKSATAECSAGKLALGAGGALLGGEGRVLGRMVFSTGATAEGVEDDDGTTTSWMVRAFAICAHTARRIVAVSGPASHPNQSATANCPNGFVPTGGGGGLEGASGEVRLAQEGAGRAFGSEDETGAMSNWTVSAFAICHSSMPGLELRASESALNSLSPKSAARTCSAGKLLTNVAAAPFGSSSPFGGQVLVTALRPETDLGGAGAIAHEDETGTTVDWRVKLQIMCATPPPGLELVTKQSPATSNLDRSVVLSCSTGKTLLGTGAEIHGGSGQVMMDDIRPHSLLNSVAVTAVEDETGTTDPWSLRAYAICANA